MSTSMHYGAKKSTFLFALQLRKNLTPAEKFLWEFLRRHLMKYRFKCQHPTWIYVVDFYCHPLKFVIEVDGSIHLLKEIHENDVDRETNLKSFGLNILRFTNDEVLHDSLKVIQKIEQKIEELSTAVNFKSKTKSPL
ncbi:MAG: endonuclease domain-containing protein [Saprospiraceae bacterium]|uniref:Endonuclease domain-containing protein n=1 Tax=Candidatus Opimibacter skivensis TaxID=2982028 RepID=A0A9D7XSF1_9BACT|nr:endonuclease domain-containing protein [Candidatus Opimibacter skivensis]